MFSTRANKHVVSENFSTSFNLENESQVTRILNSKLLIRSLPD